MNATDREALKAELMALASLKEAKRQRDTLLASLEEARSKLDTLLAQQAALKDEINGVNLRIVELTGKLFDIGVKTPGPDRAWIGRVIPFRPNGWKTKPTIWPGT